MKKINFLFMMIVLSFASLPVFSQQAKWDEMDNFHAVMSASFHPSEENNLQPLKEKAADLLGKAKAWQKATVPEGYNGAVTKPILKELVKQCKLIKAAVDDNKTDAELKIMITKAHDIFHELKEKCMK